MKESTKQKSRRILEALLQGRRITPFEANQIGNTTDGTRFIRFIREKYPVKSEKVDDKYVLSETAIQGFLKHNENHKAKGTGFLWIPKDVETTGGADC